MAPLIRPRGSSRWGTPRKLRRGLDLCRLHADGTCGGGRQKHVLAVVGAWHGQGFRRKQDLLLVAHHAAGIDPQVSRLAAGVGSLRADPHTTGPAWALLAQIRIVGVEDRRAGLLDQATLDGPVGIDAAVALQMVWGEGGPDADAWTDAACRLNLVTAQFHHQPVRCRGAGLLQAQRHFGGGYPHVSSHGCLDPAGAQHMAEQMGDGGFAIGAGDPDPGDVLQGIPGQGHLPIHSDTGLAQLPQGRVIPGNARADHHLLELIEPGGVKPRTAAAC